MDFNKYCTLGIFAHANAGKTTVTENILYEANIIKKIGRVDDGTTVTDSMSVERNRGITVKSSVVSFNNGQEQFSLIGTPGHVDFSSEVERAINTLDGAILVVSAVEGVEAQTYTIYESLRKKKIPTIVFINKVDRKNADYSRVVSDLKTKLGMKLVKLSNISYDDDNIIVSESNIDDLMNDLAEYDDYLVDDYLNGTISKDMILNKVFELSKKGSLCVVLGGTALKGIGTKQLFNHLSLCLPTYECNNNEDFSGEVISENSESLTLHREIPPKMISDFPVTLSQLTSGRGIFSSNIIRYADSVQQNILNEYVGFDPRNEVRFVISEMGGNLDNLDVAVSKKRKSSRSKFNWKSEEKKN